jgi:hypothetical protein
MAIKRNLHSVDRVLRLIIGVGCLALTIGKPEIIGNQVVNVLVGIFGVVNLWAGFVANCPVYHVTGFSTYSKKSAEK